MKKGPPTPGGLAFYHSPAGGADPGHVAIVANAGSVVSQGGGMGPQMRALKYMPLLWTGIPPGGFHGAGGAGGGAGGNGAADGSVIAPTAAAAQAWMKAHMSNYGWGAAQWSPLLALWNHESGWRWNAQNPTSPAYGIPQADPGSKMASAGADWRTNSVTQMKWGAEYIKNAYNTPGNAWTLWQARSPHWYDEGGWLPPGLTLTHNNTGTPGTDPDRPPVGHDQRRRHGRRRRRARRPGHGQAAGSHDPLARAGSWPDRRRVRRRYQQHRSRRSHPGVLPHPLTSLPA